MKVSKLKLERFIIPFLILFILKIPPAYPGEKDVNFYKSSVAVSENIERINWKWWENFDDPLLLNILKESIENNFDILIAGLKVEEAKNYANSARRNLFPSASLGASYMEAESSRIDTYGRLRFYTNSRQRMMYMPLEFSYEFDIWGKNRDESAYFEKSIDFAEFEKNFIIMTTLSDISAIYFNILKNERLISFYDEIYRLKKKKLDINLEKFEQRLVSKPQILAARKELNIAEEELNLLKAGNRELKNRFYFLVAGEKEKKTVKFRDIDDINLFYSGKIEINTAHIANRPDVLMAESQIKMARLDAKIAKKNLLPSFMFTGDIFQVSRLFNEFLHSESIMYKIGYGFFYDLLQKDNNLSVLKARKTVYKQALKAYEKAIVSSITDVNNSLLHLKSSIKNYNRAKQTSSLDKEALENEKEKLDMNLITREDYLASQEEFIRSKIVEYESKTQCLIHSISLYKALGGNV